MSVNLAKRNRLNGKMNFKPRDWKVALDGLDDFPRVPMKNGRPRPRPAQEAKKSAS